MSDSSDIEMQSALPKKTKKMPKQPKSPSEDHLAQEPKKISTKVMIHEALNELKNRKGTSLYAIKKFIAEKHKVDIEKINYIIKKLIKTGVETGTIVQTKGVGASGSFKLAPEKKVEKKKPKKTEKKKKVNTEKADTKTNKEKPAAKVEKTKKSEKTKPVKTSEPKSKNTKEKSGTDKVKKMAKEKMTPAKKRAVMMKRKSIGSIIKPPKMKPRGKS
ncbi:histone H1-like [Plodia interpunctella]|uniref:histone H1-like n=1 Tax=Plodia interpunctella TaxID=58824 RepID=UPI002368C30A|nr:histone H1-like [Plodia interpunctella]